MDMTTTFTTEQKLFFDRCYAQAQDEIVADVQSLDVRPEVKDFEDLQSMVDANEYGKLVSHLDEWQAMFPAEDQFEIVANMLQDRLDAWIKSGIIPTLAQFADAYPKHTFHSVDRDEIDADSPDGDVPEYLIAFHFEGSNIVDPYASDCGRFQVDPFLHYGLTPLAAHNLRKFNRVVY